MGVTKSLTVRAREGHPVLLLALIGRSSLFGFDTYAKHKLIRWHPKTEMVALRATSEGERDTELRRSHTEHEPQMISVPRNTVGSSVTQAVADARRSAKNANAPFKRRGIADGHRHAFSHSGAKLAVDHTRIQDRLKQRGQSSPQVYPNLRLSRRERGGFGKLLEDGKDVGDTFSLGFLGVISLRYSGSLVPRVGVQESFDKLVPDPKKRLRNRFLYCW